MTIDQFTIMYTDTVIKRFLQLPVGRGGVEAKWDGGRQL